MKGIMETSIKDLNEFSAIYNQAIFIERKQGKSEMVIMPKGSRTFGWEG